MRAARAAGRETHVTHAVSRRRATARGGPRAGPADRGRGPMCFRVTKGFVRVAARRRFRRCRTYAASFLHYPLQLTLVSGVRGRQSPVCGFICGVGRVQRQRLGRARGAGEFLTGPPAAGRRPAGAYTCMRMTHRVTL